VYDKSISEFLVGKVKKYLELVGSRNMTNYPFITFYHMSLKVH